MHTCVIRSNACIAVQSTPGILSLHPCMHQADSHDEEVLTFSRRGLAITQHLQHASEPQHPMGCPLPVNSSYSSLQSSRISSSLHVCPEKAGSEAVCVALTLGAAVCARRLHLLCQHLRDLHMFASELTSLWTNHKSCACILTLDVTYPAVTAIKTPDMLHHMVILIQGLCRTPFSDIAILIVWNFLGEAHD